MPEMSPELIAAIENSYRIFSTYNIGSDVDFAAEVSVGDEERARMKRELATGLLPTLKPDLVFAYVEYIDAAHHDGRYRTNEFRYFLPRALELIAAKAPGSDWALECLARNLSRANVRHLWPSAEVEAIDHVLSLAHLDSWNPRSI